MGKRPSGRNPSPSPKRRLKAEERRAQILDTALPVFAQRGYMGTGTRDLARAAGVTEPVLYRHFAGKSGLFCALVEIAEARLTEAIRGLFADAQADAAGRLEALGAGLPHLLDAHRDELRILSAAALAHEEPEILEIAGRALQGMGRSLTAAFRGSGLRPGVRAETAGFLLLEVGMGAALLHPLGLVELDRGRFSASAVTALLRGIAR